MSSYSDLLKDPRWQKLRLQVFERDDFTCLSCRSKEKTLHVHHLRYTKGRKPWEYKTDELITLCDTCHETEELIKRDDFNSVLKWYSINCRMPMWVLSRIVHAAAFAYKCDKQNFERYREAHYIISDNEDYKEFTFEFLTTRGVDDGV